MASRIWVPGLFSLAVISLVGCSQTDRTIHLAESKITFGTASQLPADLPISISSDGSRFAALADETVKVYDTDSLKELASLKLSENYFRDQKAPDGLIMFSQDASTLMLPLDSGYTLWNYGDGTTKKSTDNQQGVGMWTNQWNVDRTTAIVAPNGSGNTGWVVTPSKRFPLNRKDSSGFDEYGNAWFGTGQDWSKVDRQGHLTQEGEHPKFLVPDQGRDRGSMHLAVTTSNANYQGANAYITCVWLSDDKAVPYPNGTPQAKSSYKAALVFAGMDVDQYGFVPGRNMVYVACSSGGSYLIPFRQSPNP